MMVRRAAPCMIAAGGDAENRLMRWGCPAPLPEQERVAYFYGLWALHGCMLAGACVPDEARAEAAERGMATSPMGQRACCCWREGVCWAPAAVGRLLEPVAPALLVYACALSWVAFLVALSRAEKTGRPEDEPALVALACVCAWVVFAAGLRRVAGGGSASDERLT